MASNYAPLGAAVGRQLLDSPETIREMQALRDRLRRLETAVEATGLGLWEWDIATDALVWNQRNRELLGVMHDRPLTIQDFTALVHPDDRAILSAAYATVAAEADGGAFTMEYRALATPGGKVRWLQTRGRLIKDSGEAGLVVGANLDITDRKVAEERRSLILGELAHRSKNGITVLMTIVAQTARNATDVKQFEELLMARLKAMADSQDLVTQSAGQPLPLTDLLDRALEPFDQSRFTRDPQLVEVNIPMEVVVALALLLHELATNALKYGPLSVEGGSVTLSLGEVADRKATLTWVEAGGPPVAAVARRGFGSRLMDISLRNTGGHVEARFDPDGFKARIRFPVGRSRP